MKTQTVPHTPTQETKWIVKDNRIIQRFYEESWNKQIPASFEDVEIGKFNSCDQAHTAARAVNAYEDYKEIAMYARALLKALEPRFMRTGCSDTEEVALKCLREAIAQAEGK